jgi:hypothetical protein
LNLLSACQLLANCERTEGRLDQALRNRQLLAVLTELVNELSLPADVLQLFAMCQQLKLEGTISEPESSVQKYWQSDEEHAY